MSGPQPPMALLAELTHRCPLQCPYCSNPIALERRGLEMATEAWLRVIDEAAAIGCMQIHFSGGEPTARVDLERLVAHAAKAELYTNLITSGVLLDEPRIAALAHAGLEHVQLSFQDAFADGGDHFGGLKGGHETKLRIAKLVRGAGLPLTLNFVIHRQNAANVGAMLELALSLGAHRAEIANTQYYGWALRNRAVLMPSLAQLETMTRTIAVERERLKGVLVIDYVVPDYYASRPKPCMGGWGARFLNVTPSGAVLPCHAAESIAGMKFDNVRERSLGDIWLHSEAFNRFRGTDWMAEPCKSCERREIDWGGCRCQAFALTGDAAKTDPACSLSGDHQAMVASAVDESSRDQADFIYRHFTSAPALAGR
jgi:pyrroloquinoline quinone biosynthesis protein E